MIKPLDRRLLAPALALLLVFTLACGGEEETGGATPAGTSATAPGPRAGMPEETLRYEGKTQKGEEFEAQIGGAVEMPSDFPEDLPRYPGATATASLAAGAQGTFVAFSTEHDQRVVVDYYKKELPGMGWTIENQASVGGQDLLSAAKGRRRASLAFSTAEGTTRISIALSDKAGS